MKASTMNWLVTAVAIIFLVIALSFAACEQVNQLNSTNSTNTSAGLTPSINESPSKSASPDKDSTSPDSTSPDSTSPDSTSPDSTSPSSKESTPPESSQKTPSESQKSEKKSAIITKIGKGYPVKEVEISPGPVRRIQPAGAASGTVRTVFAGELVSFSNLAANDPDFDFLTYKCTKPLNANCEWQTKSGDEGKYYAYITVTDGTIETKQEVFINVKRPNHPPVIQPIGPIYIGEGDVLDMHPIITDQDDDEVTVAYEWLKKRLPYQTTYDDAGKYGVLIVASDGDWEVRRNVVVNIEDVNRPPYLDRLSLRDRVIRYGETLELKPEVSDPDSDELFFIYGFPLDPLGKFTPEEKDIGNKYVVNVSVTDGSVEISDLLSLAVIRGNYPPVLSGVRDIQAKEGESIKLSITAKDPEDDDVKLTYSGWMNSNTRRLSYIDAGKHIVYVTANDGFNEVKESFTVDVENVNRPPEFVEDAFR